jgi:YidC/Oxa1 family membrane protein insertase
MTNVYLSSKKGLLTEGFFWIPSLAGPTTIAARQNGQGISWLFPFTVSTDHE